MYAQIIIDIANSAIDRVFTYLIPASLNVEPGHHVLVPFGRGNSPKEGFVLSVSESTSVQDCKSIFKTIEPYPVLLPCQLELCSWMQTAYHCLAVDALRLMIPAQLRGSRIKEKFEKTLKLAEGLNRDSCLGSMRSPLQKEVFKLLWDSGVEMARTDVLAFIPNSSQAINALVKKGWVITNEHSVFRRPAGYNAAHSVHQLTNEQAEVSQRVCHDMGVGASTFLLHGVTGSGKTEVYLKCIEHCLSLGKRAIVLVPEIALTPQTASRFCNRFGDDVAILHSKLSHGERFDEWRRIRLGSAKIVIGARSAIFAPINNLGLIIIDEEHENSYQSETSPRYQAIEIAQHRAKSQGATVLLGSATPSLLSYYRAQSGRYKLLELNNRVLNRPLPAVKVIDMRDEFLNGNNGLFSNALKNELAQCFSLGQQAMLFINRRGYSTFLACPKCGYVEKCPNCDISMTYHKASSKLKCHYCGSSRAPKKVCPQCASPNMRQHGFGTEQVEETVKEFFPNIKCLRLDTDTTARKGAMDAILNDFSKGKAQVLIGTQMIAKGHDFPMVTLVGVISADTTLNLPDFRAAERTFQLLTQVAGRAGRDEAKGKVIIQTNAPTHPIVRFAQTHDYTRFYQYEILQRRKGLYPPYSVFVRLLFRGGDEQTLQSFGRELATVLEQLLVNRPKDEPIDDLLLLSAAPSPVSRLQGQYRYQIVIKLLRTKQLPSALKCIYDTCKERCQSFVPNIEINPQEMF